MDIQKNFMLYTTSRKLKYFASSSVTFATGDNSIAATGVGSAFPDVGTKIAITGAAQGGNNSTFTILSSTANKIVVKEPVTAESTGASVKINEVLHSDWLLSHHHSILAINYHASKPCTIYIDQGYNAIDIDYTTTIPCIGATVMPPYEIDTTSKYFRVRILNGGVDQTNMRVFVVGKN